MTRFADGGWVVRGRRFKYDESHNILVSRHVPGDRTELGTITLAKDRRRWTFRPKHEELTVNDVWALLSVLTMLANDQPAKPPQPEETEQSVADVED